MTTLRLDEERRALIATRARVRAQLPAAEQRERETAAALAAAQRALRRAEQAIPATPYAWAPQTELAHYAAAHAAVDDARTHLRDADAAHQAAARVVTQLGRRASEARTQLGRLNSVHFHRAWNDETP